ncbi:hypothetical protein F5Y16DRAFT_402920 [Xylariaceae sp. FL0255]|nr:hypothetical protein F5Y16DRAFT_402920 [Xylariaceae sp. FL0255]
MAVVILGAGHAGLPAAHYILKYYAAKFDLKVVLVSESEDYYWPIASPRAVLPDQLDDDNMFYNIPENFAKYPASRFEFVSSRAESWDPESNSVRLKSEDETERVLQYHTLIIATGYRAKDEMPWKLVGGSEKTHTTLADMREKIRQAGSIVACGKSVTLITSSDMILEARVLDSVRHTSKALLEKIDVQVLTGTRVKTITTNDMSGATVLELWEKDGSTETMTTDLFIPTCGTVPNTEFVPERLLQPSGYLRGDVNDIEPQQVNYAEAQVRHIMASFEKYLAGAPKLPIYHPNKQPNIHVVSIGPDYATGHVGSWRPWNFIFWFMKSRHLGTDSAAGCAAGKRFLLGGGLF